LNEYGERNQVAQKEDEQKTSQAGAQANQSPEKKAQVRTEMKTSIILAKAPRVSKEEWEQLAMEQ